MYTLGFGQLLTDILTINPAIRDIPSASAILDVSNYTFNAVTLGKDAEGFKFHAHTILSVSNGYNDRNVTVVRYNSISPSSYHVSATHNYFSGTYNSVPNYPSVYDTRLERGSTSANVSSQDLGHYENAAINPATSSAWIVIGGYPPSTSSRYVLLDSSGGMVCSGTLSGIWNTQGVIDKNGFIKINELNGSATFASMPSGNGPILYTLSSVSSTPLLKLSIIPRKSDGAVLAMFGGVNHIGVWCLDINAMLKDGLAPPYTWNHLNNNRKYRLVAKITTFDNLLHHEDALGDSGLDEFLNNGMVFAAPKVGLTTKLGPEIIVNFRF